MKKLFSVLLVIGLGAFLISGCQTAQTTTAPTVPVQSLNTWIGTMARDSLAIDSGLINTTLPSLSVMDVNATAVSTPEYGADEWWSFGDSYTSSGYTFTRTFKLKIWNAVGTEIIELTDLANVGDTTDISKIWIFATWSVSFSGGSYTVKFGTATSNPLKFEGYNTASQSISGPMSISATYEDTDIEITFTYSDLQLSSSGYPDGEVRISVKESGTEVVAATITFNGTATATLTFTSGYSGTYTIDLDDGTVTSASL